MRKTEREKMLACELYDAGDNELMQMRIETRAKLYTYNQTPTIKNKEK